MENIIYEQQIDPVTANLARHVYKCRPRTNVTRGLPEWHKAMRDFKIHNSLLNLSNSHHRGGGGGDGGGSAPEVASGGEGGLGGKRRTKMQMAKAGFGRRQTFLTKT